MSDGAGMVQGAAQRHEQLDSKMFGKGGWRESFKIASLMPHRGSGLKTKDRHPDIQPHRPIREPLWVKRDYTLTWALLLL